MPAPFRLLPVFAGLMAFLFVACGGDTEEKIQSDQTDTTVEEPPEAKAETTRQIFHYIPTPIESASILQKSGASYNLELLNDVENASVYETVKSKAVNLGIYSTDLSYASIFEQTSEIMFYSSCAKKLSDGLGITEAFSDKTIERIEANLDNKDSILTIVTETYYITDNHLKASQRSNLSMLIIAGGWIEGLYIASKVLDSDPTNPELIARIAEQKYSLDNLLKLMESYGEDRKIESVKADLQTLQVLYEKVTEEQTSEGDITTDDATQTTTIDTGKKLVVAEEDLAAIASEIDSIRTKYIQP